MDVLKYCIQTDALTVKQAMKRLNEVFPKILFLLEKKSVRASLTDGDIRRYLLAGGQLDSPALTAANPAPVVARSREEAEILLELKHKIAVPVTDAQGDLTEIVWSSNHEPSDFPHLDIPVVIMAGGRGTRLDPYTRVLPKPLIPVGELPIIEHIMRRFCQYGCDTFHIIVNYKKQLLKAYFNENERQYRIHWYDEDRPLGTGGGLYLLKGMIDRTFFLTNCDILVKADYGEILRFHRESGSAVTMVAARKSLTIPYGVVETEENGEIRAMREKPEMSFLTNTGMYVVEPGILDDIPDNAPTGFPEIMEHQQKIGAKISASVVPDEAWMDMGQLEELEEMRKRLYGK